MIEGDIFRMVISIPEFGDNPAIIREVYKTTESSDPVGVHDGVHDIKITETMQKIIHLLVEPASTSALLKELGYLKRTRNYQIAIRTLLSGGVIEMTLPDSPRSKKQRYRLTEKGKKTWSDIHESLAKRIM